MMATVAGASRAVMAPGPGAGRGGAPPAAAPAAPRTGSAPATRGTETTYRAARRSQTETRDESRSLKYRRECGKV